jgi:glycopeptide antibiotics resistance protein
MIYYIQRFLITILIATPIYLIIRRPWRFNDKREWLLGAFIIYVICILSLTLDGVYDAPKAMIESAKQQIETGFGFNIEPFRTIKSFSKGHGVELFVINIVSNVVLFIPWGFGLPLLWKKNQSIPRLLLLCLSITVFIEITQLFIKRNTDIDDIILNFIGGIIGVIIYFVIAKLKPQIKKFSK